MNQHQQQVAQEKVQAKQRCRVQAAAGYRKSSLQAGAMWQLLWLDNRKTMERGSQQDHQRLAGTLAGGNPDPCSNLEPAGWGRGESQFVKMEIFHRKGGCLDKFLDSKLF